MPVSVISPGPLPTVLATTLATTLANGADAAGLVPSGAAGPPPASPQGGDTVVFSSAPFRLLADLAVAGLGQLAALLPTLERTAAEGIDPVPLGHLAKAAGAAARQVAQGYGALLAQGPDRVAAALPDTGSLRPTDRPEPTLRSLARSVGAMPGDTAPPRISDELRTATRRLGASTAASLLVTKPPAHPAAADPAQRWLAEARHLLQRTDDALDGTAPAFPPDAAPVPPAADWVALQVATARSEIAAALTLLPEPTGPAATGPAPLLARLPELASLLGLTLLLLAMGVATELWTTAAAIAILAGTGFCAWRICRAGRGFRLDGGR